MHLQEYKDLYLKKEKKDSRENLLTRLRENMIVQNESKPVLKYFTGNNNWCEGRLPFQLWEQDEKHLVSSSVPKRWSELGGPRLLELQRGVSLRLVAESPVMLNVVDGAVLQQHSSCVL